MAVKRRRRPPSRAAELERRNRLARAVFDAWPCEGLEFGNFWDDTTGLPKDGGGDTLLLFVLREMKDTVDFKGEWEDALETVRGVTIQASEDLDGLYDAAGDLVNDDIGRILW